MSPAPVFAEVLQRQRSAYMHGVTGSPFSPAAQAAGFEGARQLGFIDWLRDAKLCFEATEAGLRAEVIDD